MSHTYKDGCRGGGHNQGRTHGKDFWSRRTPPHWKMAAFWGRVKQTVKRATHRWERCEAKREIEDALS